MENDLFLVDWLSFSCVCHDTDSMIQYLGMSHCEWTPSSGFYGYRFRLYCSGISIHFCNEKVDGILVEMSGTGCRAFETFSDSSDWVSIFHDLLHDHDYHVTRLDIAFDDHVGSIPIKKIFRDVGLQNFTSRFKSTSITREDHPGRVGQTIYLGSCKSDLRFRIYDKAYERKYDDGRHWVRFECQMRRDIAYQFLSDLEKSDYNVGVLFAGLVSNYIRFVRPARHGSDSNKRRWDTAPYWSRLIGDVLPVSLWRPKDLDYNKSACESYVYGQAGNSVAALIELDGVDKFVSNLKKYKSHKVPDKIRYMIATEKALAQSNSDSILEVLNNATT